MKLQLWSSTLCSYETIKLCNLTYPKIRYDVRALAGELLLLAPPLSKLSAILSRSSVNPLHRLLNSFLELVGFAAEGHNVNLSRCCRAGTAMPTKTQRAASMGSRSDAGSFPSALWSFATCMASRKWIADFTLMQTQARFYSVPYNEKIAKFNGSKGSDVRPH